MDYLQGFLWNASWSVATHIVSAFLSETMFLSLLSLPQSLTIWMANYRVKNSRLAASVCGARARVCVCVCVCVCVHVVCCASLLNAATLKLFTLCLPPCVACISYSCKTSAVCH